MSHFTLKWTTRCYSCGTVLPAGSRAQWHRNLGHSCRDTEACERREARNIGIDSRRSLEAPAALDKD
jgi:hypothetical protein